MSKNVIYILCGLVIVVLVCFYLQGIVVSSLHPANEDDGIVPDTHQKIEHFAATKKK